MSKSYRNSMATCIKIQKRHKSIIPIFENPQNYTNERFIWHILFIGDRDFLRILLKLLDAGCLVDSKNDQGLTPLLLTLKERSYRHSDEIFSKIVHCLIDYGADIHARFPGTQKSTLCHAIDCRDLETAKYLIKAGYNVNTREEDGDLPIFRCVPFGKNA